MRIFKIKYRMIYVQLFSKRKWPLKIKKEWVK